MGRNITPSEGHFDRKDNFRYENKAADKCTAYDMARERSFGSNKVINVMLNTKTGEYTVHSHGVEMIDTIVEAKFHRGELIYLFPLGKLEHLLDAFAILDALRGSISGDYQKDIKWLNENGKTCTEELYHQAYQMDQQP